MPTTESPTTTVTATSGPRRPAVLAVGAAALGALAVLTAGVLRDDPAPEPRPVLGAVATAPAPDGDGGADVDALWAILRELDADQVGVVVAALDPEVHDDLEAVVRAAAGAASAS